MHGRRNHGAMEGAILPPDFGLFYQGVDYAITTLLLPLPRIVRPSYVLRCMYY
jgi:hypothetical protein